MNFKFLSVIPFVVLMGCESVNSINTTIGDTLAQFQELKAQDFCKLKADDLATAQRRYSNKGYIFTGKISDIQPQNDNQTVIGLLDGSDKVFSKVSNYNPSLKVGDYVKIQGNISPANFNEANKNKCYILLDNGVLK